ncbi:hypothetical protein Sango_2765100 [Sesamum angolense]|uniref:Uncharacterized protein n=1 Tax=Sesamum angolense TaxID=2727404 RepID=A0AAE1T8N4_9LAMI|nr:hypothetical protein Sango_2765100 [Sesamum angolense]
MILSGVLRGLGDDDEETVVYVLSILRDRLLVPESLVPPGLRSVLFRSVTLEQLVSISGKDDFGGAAELAHNVLLLVCTDPVNEIDARFGAASKSTPWESKASFGFNEEIEGNRGCLPQEPGYVHSIVCSFVQFVMPSCWFAAISLAADVVSSVSDGLSCSFLDKPSAFNNLSRDGGIMESGGEQQSENGVDILIFIKDLWGLHQTHIDPTDGNTYFTQRYLSRFKSIIQTHKGTSLCLGKASMLSTVIVSFLCDAVSTTGNNLYKYMESLKHYIYDSGCGKGDTIIPKSFWSSSVSFRADRLWMLRLLYAGVNTEDDAQIYVENSIFEILMSFYSSPLSDNDSKDILNLVLTKDTVRLNYANIDLNAEDITEEEDISTTFYIVRGGFVSAYEAVEVCSKTRCNSAAFLVLQAVLMSTPPASIFRMDQGKLLKFLRWTVTTAIQSKPTKVSEAEDSDYHLMAVSEKKTPEDSLVSKLLRWLTSSVILRKISCKLSKLNNNSFLERQNLDSLQSLLEYCEPGFGEDAGCDCEDVLAASIFYLLQMLGLSHTLLPTAVSALCLLLFSDPPSESEFSVGLGISLPLLCSKIHCPAEANPAWRWLYSILLKMENNRVGGPSLAGQNFGSIDLALVKHITGV